MSHAGPIAHRPAPATLASRISVADTLIRATTRSARETAHAAFAISASSRKRRYSFRLYALDAAPDVRRGAPKRELWRDTRWRSPS
jgi:hypothetical protein